jgi:hypothetical protein
VVLSAYKQMRSQSDNILSDVGESDFDRAFKFFRPGVTFRRWVTLRMLMSPVDVVIQGGSDIGHRLSEEELQQTLDFCGKLFAPTTPEEHHAAERLLAERQAEFLDVHTPIIDPRIIENVVRGHPDWALGVGGVTPDFQSNAKNPTVDSGYGELDMKKILEKVNARRVIHSEHGNGVSNFEGEPLGQSSAGGKWVARLEKGKLGLTHVDTKPM